MHLMLMTRGINQNVEIWKTFMQSQMFTWKRQPLLRDDKGNFLKDEQGNFMRGPVETTMVQGALRPIQLWEYVFPKEHLGEVLGMIKMNQHYNNMRPEVQKLSWVLRKGMGAKKIPDMPEIQNKLPHQVTSRFIPTDGVAIYTIGLREDNTTDFDCYGYYQEGL